MQMNKLTTSFVVIGVAASAAVASQVAWDGKLVLYGTMHEAIGEGHSEGRVDLAEISGTAHFYGIGAREGLKGEITFFDSSPTVTSVAADGRLAAVEGMGLNATLLAGANVPAWRSQAIEKDASAAEFDRVVHAAALKAGVDTSKPFVFTAEGEFSDARVHVINGACPMHARRNNVEIPEAQRPFAGDYKRIRGRLVGVYAENAVGKLTHPGTSTHVHIIFEDEALGLRVTGHVESIGLVKGTTLNLPQ